MPEGQVTVAPAEQPTVTLSAEQEVLELSKKTQEKFAALLEERKNNCAKEIDAALKKYGFTLQVTQVAQLVPLQK